MKFLWITILACLVSSSCVPAPTPESRIGQHFQKFSSLSLEHKKLVRSGEIAEGMSTDAVLIAWGRPSNIFEYSKNGKKGQRWDYTVSKPVSVPTRFSGFYGHRSIIPTGPSVEFVPFRVASVWFVEGKVSEWERKR